MRACLSRHRFGGCCDRSRRRYGLYQLWHMVSAWDGSAGAHRHTAERRAFNFTNEGGVGGTTRVLKNIMGMWLLQGCRKQWHSTDYASLVALAKPTPDLISLIDPDHGSFLHPENMTAAIDEFCRSTNQPVPAGQAAYVQTIFESLALKYRYVLDCLSQLTGHV